jgi:hypothetical protein
MKSLMPWATLWSPHRLTGTVGSYALYSIVEWTMKIVNAATQRRPVSDGNRVFAGFSVSGVFVTAFVDTSVSPFAGRTGTA